MHDYSQANIDSLIECPKIIIAGVKKPKVVNSSFVVDLQMRAVTTPENTREGFKAFLRQSVRLQEAFSVGLIYRPADGEEIILVRCNGKQALHANKVVDNESFVDQFHIHKATEAALMKNERPEQWAYATDKYGSYEGAVVHFAQLVNITNAEEYLSDYFAKVRQLSFELL